MTHPSSCQLGPGIGGAGNRRSAAKSLEFGILFQRKTSKRWKVDPFGCEDLRFSGETSWYPNHNTQRSGESWMTPSFTFTCRRPKSGSGADRTSWEWSWFNLCFFVMSKSLDEYTKGQVVDILMLSSLRGFRLISLEIHPPHYVSCPKMAVHICSPNLHQKPPELRIRYTLSIAYWLGSTYWKIILQNQYLKIEANIYFKYFLILLNHQNQ